MYQQVERIGILLHQGNRTLLKQQVGDGFWEAMSDYKAQIRSPEQIPLHLAQKMAVTLSQIISDAVKKAKIYRPSDSTHVVGEVLFDAGLDANTRYFGMAGLEARLRSRETDYEAFVARLIVERQQALDSALQKDAVRLIAGIIGESIVTADAEKRYAFFDMSQEMYLTSEVVYWTEHAKSTARPSDVADIVSHCVNGTVSQAVIAQSNGFLTRTKPAVITQPEEQAATKGGSQRTSPGGIILP